MRRHRPAPILVTVCLAALAGAEQRTTGVIPSRPVPPVAGARPINYVQGPTAIKNGSEVWLIANAGACCHAAGDGAWEGVYAYANEVWHPLWAADDWGRAPWRDEHEVGYPSVVWWDHPQGGMWLATYAATRVSTFGQSRRVGAGLAGTRLDPLSLWPQWAPDWVAPLGPSSWGAFPIALLSGPGSLLDLWIWDFSAHAVLRYRVDHNAAAWPVAIADFPEHAGLVPPALTDIARGPWGELYALEGLQHTTQVVREWVSWQFCGRPPGYRWQLTGRTWSHPGATTFDCGYLRGIRGDLVLPRVVVCNVSPGGVYADSGLWELRWWADPGAEIPLDWIARPVRRVLARP